MLNVVGSLTAGAVFPQLKSATDSLNAFMTKNTKDMGTAQKALNDANSFLSQLTGANNAAQAALDQAQAIQTGAGSVVNGVSSALQAAGIRVYAGATTPTALGDPMKTDLGGTGSQQVWAVVLVATDAGAWSALQALVKTA